MDKKTKGIRVLKLKERLPDLYDLANMVSVTEQILYQEQKRDAAYWMHACYNSLLQAIEHFEGAVAYLEHHEEKALGEEP